MAKLYVIVDRKVKADTFVFLQQHDGAAASYFYNWCLLQNHRDFYLDSVGTVDYFDNQYLISNAEREHICDMPSEEEENAKG
ncbi:hypothetical protein BFG07_08495 [Kosakonia cowanii]|uniref:hypothetical protein n=1 Tax=Kosakonia cowanii TaxID=208223 RepID=UPI000B973A63|nr:hypothetical protein [Kosakonia cowanii]AST68718.1 hypothetical protein BFG07_08495 [Kosakonia cowanii]